MNKEYRIDLDLIGVGYRAVLKNKETLQLRLGYTNNISINVPGGVSIDCYKSGRIVLTSNEKHQLAQFAAKIRALKKPEPYKGKGILYAGEQILRKKGKRQI